MPNLLDTIQQNRQSLAAQPTGVTDETARVQTLLRAKSGKAVSGGDTATSNLGEQQAAAQTGAQLQQLGQQLNAQTQSEKVVEAGRQQQEQIQRQAVDQARRFDTVQTRIQTNQILNDLSRNRDSLDLEKKQAGLEQAAFLLSMQDRQYVDNLQDIGRRRRLDNEAQFQSEMQNLTFGNNAELLKQKLGQQDILAANDREFQKALSSMSIEDAQKIAAIESEHLQNQAQVENDLTRYTAKQKATAANQQAMWGGVGGLVSSGLHGYSTFSTPTPSSGGGGGSGGT